MKTPTIMALAAVAVAVIGGGSAVAVTEIGQQAKPAAAVKVVPGPTKTIIKHEKTKIVQEDSQAVGSLRAVGGGIFAGPNTSDAFAQNVADSYVGYPGEQRVYSPVTGQDYWMTYRQTDPSTVTATGGNGAVVQFPG